MIYLDQLFISSCKFKVTIPNINQIIIKCYIFIINLPTFIIGCLYHHFSSYKYDSFSEDLFILVLTGTSN